MHNPRLLILTPLHTKSPFTRKKKSAQQSSVILFADVKHQTVLRVFASELLIYKEFFL